MKFYFVRHGESEANTRHIISNRESTSPLTSRGGATNTIVEHNTLTGSAQGLAFTAGGASGVVIFDNHLAAPTALILSAASTGTIEANNIAGGATGVNIAAAFTGLIRANHIHGASTGVVYSAAATLSANRIHDNGTGVVSTVAGNVNGFGFVGVADPNDIFANTTGVALTGQMQNQHVFGNTTGVSGSGILGGATLDLANLIERNATGVSGFTGTIQTDAYEVYQSLERK